MSALCTNVNFRAMEKNISLYLFIHHLLFRFTLMASDSPNVFTEITALLTIYVLDENDNAPQFQSILDDIYVFENTLIDNITQIKVGYNNFLLKIGSQNSFIFLQDYCH